MNKVISKKDDLTVKKGSVIFCSVLLGVTNGEPTLGLGSKNSSPIKVSVMLFLECICHLLRTSDTSDTFARRMTQLNASCGVTTVLFSTISEKLFIADKVDGSLVVTVLLSRLVMS